MFKFLRSYFVVASRTVRPGQVYKVAATVYSSKHPITVRASIQNNGVEVAADSQNVKKGIPEVLLMRVRIFTATKYRLVRTTITKLNILSSFLPDSTNQRHWSL